jgi:SAM-dependent methyltransferase
MSVLPGQAVARILAGQDRAQGGGLTVLEAGSGRFRHFEYPPGARITGLDISAEQLAANDYADEKIEGDVQTWTTERQWDVVISVFVLEHVEDPERAVANMLAWTRPGGLLVIAVPNALSLKGLVTRATPFGFHGWFYRHVYRRPHAIFPTTMKMCIAPRRLRRQLAGHEIVHEQFSRETFGQPFRALYGGVILVLKALTLGRWRPEDSNYLLVVRRAEASANAATTLGPTPPANGGS